MISRADHPLETAGSVNPKAWLAVSNGVTQGGFRERIAELRNKG